MATIIRGSDCSFKAICKFTNKIPLDLSECTDIKVHFVNENDEVVDVSLTEGSVSKVEPAGAGVLEVTLDKTFTLTLKLGERLDMMFTFITGENERAAIVPGILEVIPKLGES